MCKIFNSDGTIYDPTFNAVWGAELHRIEEEHKKVYSDILKQGESHEAKRKAIREGKPVIYKKAWTCNS